MMVILGKLLELQFFFGGEIMLVSQWIFIFWGFERFFFVWSLILFCMWYRRLSFCWMEKCNLLFGICNNFYGVTDQLEKYNLLALWCYESSLYGHFRLKFKLDESFGTHIIWRFLLDSAMSRVSFILWRHASGQVWSSVFGIVLININVIDDVKPL